MGRDKFHLRFQLDRLLRCNVTGATQIHHPDKRNLDDFRLLNLSNHSVSNSLRTKNSGLRNTVAKDGPHSSNARQV